MKKQIVFLCLTLLSIAGFSQISKADAALFVSNNLPTASKIAIYNTVSVYNDRVMRGSAEFPKSDIISLTAKESGFSLVVKQESGNKEKFYPYASILYLTLSGDNAFNIMLKD